MILRKALVFGSMNMDLSICCSRIPAAGETIDGDSFITNPGGKGANQAVAAARMGAPVIMVASVGDDTFGSVLVGCLEGADIDTSFVRVETNVPTGTATIIRTDGDNRIILDHGANYCCSFEDVRCVIDSVGAPGDVFLTQFECEPAATAEALAYAHGRGLFTMVNPAPARDIHPEFWGFVDYVCMNETECEAITGDYPFGPEDASLAAHKIAAFGVKQIVITLGSKGSYGYDRGEEFFVPAQKVRAVDTTAAGDTFIGSMVSANLMGMPFKEAMELATRASAITVQRPGAQQSIPSLNEVNGSL